MASSREVRAAVRAQMAEQLNTRQDAALTVAAAWEKIDRARERLAAAERDAASAVTAATAVMSAPDLAQLTGVPVADLRRLARNPKATAIDPPTPADEPTTVASHDEAVA